METMFEVSGYFDAVSIVKVVKRNEKTIVLEEKWWHGKISNRRVSLNGSTKYFDTFEEAKAFLVEKKRSKLEQAKRGVDTARNKLRDAEALKVEDVK